MLRIDYQTSSLPLQRSVSMQRHLVSACTCSSGGTEKVSTQLGARQCMGSSRARILITQCFQSVTLALAVCLA